MKLGQTLALVTSLACCTTGPQIKPAPSLAGTPAPETPALSEAPPVDPWARCGPMPEIFSSSPPDIKNLVATEISDALDSDLSTIQETQEAVRQALAVAGAFAENDEYEKAVAVYMYVKDAINRRIAQTRQRLDEATARNCRRLAKGFSVARSLHPDIPLLAPAFSVPGSEQMEARLKDIREPTLRLLAGAETGLMKPHEQWKTCMQEQFGVPPGQTAEESLPVDPEIAGLFNEETLNSVERFRQALDQLRRTIDEIMATAEFEADFRKADGLLEFGIEQINQFEMINGLPPDDIRYTMFKMRLALLKAKVQRSKARLESLRRAVEAGAIMNDANDNPGH